MCTGLGSAVDKTVGKAAQPWAPDKLKNWAPSLGESMDPHYMRTNSKAEERHKKLGISQSYDVPAPPPPPQESKAPDINTYRTPPRRYSSNTVLTGPSGIPSSLSLGSTYLGGR